MDIWYLSLRTIFLWNISNLQIIVIMMYILIQTILITIFTKSVSDIMLHEHVASPLNNSIQSVSESSEYNSEKQFINDSCGCPHFSTPTTGPSLIVLKPQQFQSFNIEAHLHNLSASNQCRCNDKRNYVLLTVDGSPDW